MTNDTSTLRGSLTECKDQLISELANQGVTATYDPTTGLLGLIHKISEITPTTPSLTLATNKNILSYYDSETATLTATHSLGAGQLVSVYNAVSGAKIGDMTDNNDGTYTYTYNSAGVGDISMTCATTTLESNSVTITDAILYRSGYQTIANLNITLPTQFKLTCISMKTGTSNAVGTVNLWQGSNAIGFGSYANNTTSYEWGYYNGSSWSTTEITTKAHNTELNWELTYNEGGIICKADSSTRVMQRTMTFDKLDMGVSSQTNMKFKDLLIVPL